MTEAESRKIRVTKRKEWEEDGTENGRGRKRRTGKGKERERTEGMEGAEDEWKGWVEERLEKLEGTVVEGFRRVLWMVGEVMWELGEVKELMESESVGSEGSEEDGEGEEEAVEEMVDGEGGKELEVEVVGGGEAGNGGDVEMAE